MPDSYWEEFARRQKRAEFSCPSCGGTTTYHVNALGKCEACRKVPIPPPEAICVSCGEKFLPTKNRTKRCLDCVGDRPETKSSGLGERLSDAVRMMKTGDSM